MKTKTLTVAMLLMAVQAQASGVVINNGAALVTKNGSSIVVRNGDWTNNSATGLSGSGRVMMSGTSSHDIGGSQSTLFPALEINNSAGVSISADVGVQSNLTFSNGTLTLGNNNLLLKSGAAVVGAASDRYVVASGSGALRREFAGIGSFTYPVGDASTYAPATVDFASGTFSGGNYAGVRVTPGKHPSVASSEYLNRYWSFGASGISGYSVNLAATYVPADVTGNEASLNSVYFKPTLTYGPPALPSTHTVSVSGQSAAGDLTAMASAVAPAVPYNMEVRPATEAGKLTVTWNTPTDPLFSHSHVYRSTTQGVIGTLVGDNISIVSFTDSGLQPNSAYYYLVRSVNPAGVESSNTAQVSGTTLQSVVAPNEVSSLTVTDTTLGGELLLGWSNPASQNFSGVAIYRSTQSGSLGSQVTSGLLTSYRDTGLTNNSTYYYTVKAFDSYGQTSSGVTVSQIPTNSVPPLPVSALKAALLPGGQAQLTWSRSASGDVAYYNIYGDNGTGTINYGSSIGRITHPAVTWTSSALTAGTDYRFAIRSEDSSGVLENNTDRIIGVATFSDPAVMTAVIPDAPKTGETVSGNSVSVSARLLTGNSADISGVTFQYRLATGGSWNSVATVTSVPYAASWDTSLLASGMYQVRAVASGTNTLAADQNVYVTVNVGAGATVVEQTSGGLKQRTQTMPPTAPVEVVMTGGTGNGVTRVAFLEGNIVVGGSVTITDLNPATEAPPVPNGYANPQVFRAIAIGGGMQLADKTTMVELPYRDDNNDGIVDGTAIRAADLKVCHYSNSAWSCLDSFLDSANKRVRANTTGFSPFGLLAPPVPVGSGWNLVSVPLVPSSNSVSSVFAQATSFTGYTQRWDALAQNWTTATTVAPGLGYIVWGDGVANRTISVSGTETPDTAQTVTLYKGWNLIGHPFRYRVNVADLTVTHSGVTKSFLDAQASGWMAATAYKYVGGAYQYQTPGDGGTLEPWAAYWILSDVTCTLTIPNIQAQ